MKALTAELIPYTSKEKYPILLFDIYKKVVSRFLLTTFALLFFYLNNLPQTFKSIFNAQFLQMLFLLHFEHIVFCFNRNISKFVEFHAASIENFDKSTE